MADIITVDINKNSKILEDKDGEILKLKEMLEKEGIPFDCHEKIEDYPSCGRIHRIHILCPCSGEGLKWSFLYQFAYNKDMRTSFNSIGADWGWIECAKIDRGYVNIPFFRETAEQAFGIVRDDYKKGCLK